VRVLRPEAVQRTGARIRVDGAVLPDAIVALIDDGREHDVVVEPLGA
jgi:hypothetical protein